MESQYKLGKLYQPNHNEKNYLKNGAGHPHGKRMNLESSLTLYIRHLISLGTTTTHFWMKTRKILGH